VLGRSAKTEERRLLDRYIKTARHYAAPDSSTWRKPDPEHVEVYQEIMARPDASRDVMFPLVVQEVSRTNKHEHSGIPHDYFYVSGGTPDRSSTLRVSRRNLPEQHTLGFLARALLISGVRLDDRLIIDAIDQVCAVTTLYATDDSCAEPLVHRSVEYAGRFDPETALGRAMLKLKDKVAEVQSGENLRLAIDIARAFRDEQALPLEPGEPWAERALADMAGRSEDETRAWRELIEHAATARSAKPSKKWLKAARVLVDQIGPDAVDRALSEWLEAVDLPRSPDDTLIEGAPHLYLPHHAEILKGLCWIAGTSGCDAVARSLGLVALATYRKIPGEGMREQKVGNAAVHALGQIPGRASVGQLAMLRIKVKYGQAQKMIEKALDAAAEREGLPRDEIEEIAVPSYGLDEVGVATETLGDFTAELRVGAGDKGVTHAELAFVNASGKRIKSVPAAVKRDHAEELKELKASLKDIKRMLPAQRDRLDGLFVQGRTWSYGTWRERYLDHPLIGVLARRMIWVFDNGREKAAGAWLADGFDPDGDPPTPAHADGRLVGVDGQPFEPDPDSTVVSLWHPIDADAPPGGDAVRPDVEDWRRFYEDRGVRQPFKQAHREIYLLTDAEIATEVYSNRFAAHVLRQHQCHALCQQRAWKSMLRIAADTVVHPAHKVLPAYGLRAEFWAESVGDEYGVDTLESGAFIHIATDQVRFYALDERMNEQHAWGGGVYADGTAPEPERLDRVPPLAFSEIMRDVDLFVGVSSVGNNPQWQDGGPDGRFLDAWQNYSFGDLNGSAETRRDLLSRLLPRLKIHDACTLTGRFLIVLGKKRTYKIHLGSGNILMEPGDQYLCIVPDASMEAGPRGRIHLPFEGDRTLALILSKAFMLAEDDTITDRTILSQINRR